MTNKPPYNAYASIWCRYIHIHLKGYRPRPDAKVALFDIEANGLLHEANKILCISVGDLSTGKIRLFGPTQILEALEYLCTFDFIVAHNGLSYDVPLIEKLYPDVKLPICFDTLVVCRMHFGKDFLEEQDKAFNKKHSSGKESIPARLIGSNSLAAWGYRLGVLKGRYGQKENAWDAYSDEMGRYCMQDVVVLSALYLMLLQCKISEDAIDLEHAFQTAVMQQEMTGVCFDMEKAHELEASLRKRRDELEEVLLAIFPPLEKKKVFRPKTNNAALGYVKGAPVEKTEIIPFNPSSRRQVAERLIAQGCKLPVTDKGNPHIDDDVLKELEAAGVKGAKELREYYECGKLLAALADGDKALMKSVKSDGRIHGHVISTGTVSGRCSHVDPNLAQIPRRNEEYGQKFRDLFYAPAGFVMVGGDVKSLELRGLASYMSVFDAGAYIKAILEGDIHTANQEAAGLPTRDAAKTFIFAFLYGGGNRKLGAIVMPNADEATQQAKGKELRGQFLQNIPALKTLVTKVKDAARRGWIKGIDGRRLYVREDYRALNLLIQSAGALVVKYATVLLLKLAAEAGLVNGEDYFQVLHVHDEVQYYCKPEHAEMLAQCFRDAIRLAGEHFKLACPMEADVKIGQTWAETH